MAKLWPKKACMPIFGHTFLDITKPFLCQLGWNILRELRKLLYLLVVRNLSYDTYFSFLRHFLLENAHGHHTRPYWSGVSNPVQKVGPLSGPFGPTTIAKSCFLTFSKVNPPKVHCILPEIHLINSLKLNHSRLERF